MKKKMGDQSGGERNFAILIPWATWRALWFVHSYELIRSKGKLGEIKNRDDYCGNQSRAMNSMVQLQRYFFNWMHTLQLNDDDDDDDIKGHFS